MDAEFGGFVQSLPQSDQVPVESFLKLLVAADAGFDMEALGAMDVKTLAGKLQSTEYNFGLRYHWGVQVVVAVRNLIAEHCPDDQFDAAFYGSMGREMSSGLMALQKSLVAAEVVSSVRALGGVLFSTVVTQMDGWNSGHLFFHGYAGWVLSALRDYNRMVAEQAKLPVVGIAFQIRPTNGDARPLGGLLVKVTNTSPTPDVVLGTRMLDYNGIAYVQYEGSTESSIDLVFEVMDADEETLVTSDPIAFDPATETSVEVEVAVPALPVNSAVIGALATELSLTIPSELSAYLVAESLVTLDDLRRLGGLANQSATAVTENLALCQELDQHAMLELIEDDAALRAFLIDEGYTSPSKIAAKTRAEFVTELSGATYGEVTLAGVYLKAAKTSAVGRALFMGKGAVVASGYRYPAPINETISDLFRAQCDCEECRSGVSPLAYLAALLDYGVRHVKDGPDPVDVDWFQGTFYQGFCEMPANCAALEKRVCQIRIAIEVLRQYMGGIDITYANRKKYLEATYHRLLNAAGISFDELRTVVTSVGNQFDAQREAMAERVGVTTAQLDALYLESTGMTPTLTEENLELLFGYQSTLRNPFSDGLKLDDGSSKVYRWQFEGVEWGRNTDAEGYLYLSLTNLPNAVSIYKANARTADDLVGYALVSAQTPYTAQIVQQNDSGLFGQIELASTTADPTIKVSVVPLLLSWRLARQRERWLAADWPESNTYFSASRSLPIIEPDLMGPDDIRMAERPGTTGVVAALDLYATRRDFVDSVVGELEDLGVTIEDLFDFMSSTWSLSYVGPSGTVNHEPWNLGALPVTIDGSTWGNLFGSIRTALQGTVDYADAIDAITNVLHLTMDSYSRLDSLYSQWLANVDYTGDDLEDLVNILTQAAKVAYYPDWILEEDAEEITFRAELFWEPIREPMEGRWDEEISSAPFYASPIATPFIDPYEVDLVDLPDPVYGEVAIALWNTRLADINVKLVDIYNEHTTGYADMVTEAVGTVFPFTGAVATFNDMGEVMSGIDDADNDVVADAFTFINESLLLTEAEFRVAAVVMAEEDSPGGSPSNDEYMTLAKVLVNGWRRNQWGAWRTYEDGNGFDAYWKAYKHELPKWRGSHSLRRLWLEGLAFYSRVPIVDPDLIKAGDMVNPEYNNDADLDNPAYVLWRDRMEMIEGSSGWLDDIGGAGIEANLEAVLGISDANQLVDLHDQYQAHRDVSKRLAQLNLDPERLGFVVKLLLMEIGSVTISDHERTAFDAIMLQVMKERNYGWWNAEERSESISLSPAYFRIAHANLYDFVQYVDAILLPWRTSAAARRDWQSKLESRIDHEKTMVEANARVVKQTEDETLMMLRDVLVKYSGATGNTVAEKAEYLTKMLLMDFQIQCCQETTRVAQAIETLQVLYFSIRTGLILDEYPDLSIPGDDFEDDWKWLGTYGTWRSLMFVYLYPENILYPNLKTKVSGRLRGIMDQVRDAGGVNPVQSCEMLHSYEAYLKDMADLGLQATVTAGVDGNREGCATVQSYTRDVYFHFAVGGHTHTGYYSTVDTGAASAQVAQSHWEPVPGLEGIERVIGATVLKNNKGRRYVYVFALKSMLGEQPELCANRFDLSTFQWEDDLSGLKVDRERSYNLAPRTLKLAEKKREDDPIYLIGHAYELEAVVNFSGTPYTLKAGGVHELYDRWVVYNCLDGEGMTWRDDAWSFKQFLWLASFDLVGAVLTAERFLLMLAVVQFVEGGDCHLAYHSFYEGSLQGPGGAKRVIPDDDAFLGVPLIPSQPWSTNDLASFNNFKALSQRLRVATPLTPFNDYERSICIIKSTVGDGFEWYYNRSQSVGTYCQAIAVDQTWDTLTSQLSVTPITPYLPLGAAPNSIPPNRSLEVVINAAAVSSQFEASFIGPCFDHAVVPLANGSPRQRSAQFANGSKAMLSGVKVGANPSVLIVLNTIFSNGHWQPVSEHASATVSAARKAMIALLFGDNYQGTHVSRSYLEEAYYLLPMFLALELQKGKYFEDALGLYRLVYDFTLAPANRKVYHGLVAEESISTSYSNVMAWLEDPENPHAIAGTRANAYTRFTIFSIVRCMLDWADQEFTQDSAESVPRARTLYLSAIELLKDEIFAYEEEGCGMLLDGLDALVTDAGWYPEWLRLKAAIAAINNHDVIDDIVNGFSPYTGGIAAVFANGSLSWEERIQGAEDIYQTKLDMIGSVPDRLCKVVSDYTLEESLFDLELSNSEVGADPNRLGSEIYGGYIAGLAGITGTSIEDLESEDSVAWLGEPINYDSGPGLELSLNQRLGGEKGLYEAYYATTPMSGLRLRGGYRRPYIPYLNHYFCVPRNPVPFNLLLHAELNLFKIRHCRNIAGIHRELEPYSAPIDSVSGMPLIGAGGRLAFPSPVSVSPTPYRYEVVLARAKELVQLAQQAEGAMLSALEKLDAEYYSVLRARQDLSMANASVRLQDLRIMEAEHEIDMAELQLDRAQLQVETYQDWIDMGISQFETQILLSYISLNRLQKEAAFLNYAQLAASTLVGSTHLLGETFGLLALPLYLSAVGVQLGLGGLQLSNQFATIEANTSISINQMFASWEQRNREWRFQKELGIRDVAIANQQILLANDRLRITGQERSIAQMQASHAAEVVEFLRTKFTNVELYDWMSGVLRRIYSFYLQHATSMAKVAQQQLSFERQEAPANLILDDYWSAPNDGPSANVTVDRKGLTGSARLQMDLTKLDLYAFETEKRKLQLTKTMSLAQLFPVEFELFRQTGVLTFRTQMEWFDRDFPGHYLRLIKRVRTSVIALVPPGEGVRAKLSTTGVSRVVVGGDSFQTIVSRRGAESVSLTSPVEATGLFEMLPDRGDMLYPFEGMGVDALWEFKLERASNPINFNTIADVLVTFEYTALENFDYAKQVVRGLDPRVLADRSFSMRYLFPDQWYDLHNASLLHSSLQYIVDLKLLESDFPSMVRLKEVAYVTVMLVPKDGNAVTLKDIELLKDGVGGMGTTNANGVVSTRTASPTGTNVGAGYAGNSNNWAQIVGVPWGTWRLNFSGASLVPPNNTIQNPIWEMLDGGKLEDILLVVSFRGAMPDYVI